MIWRIMDTYNLVKDIKRPFTSGDLRERMLVHCVDPNINFNQCYKHLYRLTKQGFLTRTGATKTPYGKPVYVYEVV